jgi:hypothetical protein
VDAVLVEFKSAAPGTATLPASREGMTAKILAESPRAIAFQTTAAPTFQEPAGTTHEYDQVVIALDAVKMSLALDGKPAKTDWKRGDVQFIGRGTPHAAKNTSGKPVDFVGSLGKCARSSSTPMASGSREIERIRCRSTARRWCRCSRQGSARPTFS